MSSDFTFEDITRMELKESQRKAFEYMDEHMEEYYNDIVIPEIKKYSREMNLPRKFVDGFKFVKTGKNRGKIINTWGTTEKPLAKWFNYGTKDKIWIEPKDPDGVLAFPLGGGKSSSAIFFQGSGKGDTGFSKGHYISGQPDLQPMELGYKASEPALRAHIAKDITERFKNKNG